MARVVEIDLGSVSWVRIAGRWVEIHQGDFFNDWPFVRPLDAREAQRADEAAEWIE